MRFPTCSTSQRSAGFRRSHRGVTLVELMVTIAVLVILLTMAIPAFNLLENRRLEGATQGVHDLIQLARTEAIKQAREMTVVFDEAAWCVGVTDREGCDCTLDDPGDVNACTVVAGFDNGAEARAIRRVAGENFRDVGLASTTAEIRFDFVRGTATLNTSSPAVITLDNTLGRERTLNVSTVGRISQP